MWQLSFLATSLFNSNCMYCTYTATKLIIIILVETPQAHNSYGKVTFGVVAFPSHQTIQYTHKLFHYLSLYFVIEELLLEFGQGVVCTIVVQIQGIKHIPEGG